jgi:hypothetical protein
VFGAREGHVAIEKEQTPPSHIWSERRGVASRWGGLAVTCHGDGCSWGAYKAGIPLLGPPGVPPHPPD